MRSPQPAFNAKMNKMKDPRPSWSWAHDHCGGRGATTKKSFLQKYFFSQNVGNEHLLKKSLWCPIFFTDHQAGKLHPPGRHFHKAEKSASPVRRSHGALLAPSWRPWRPHGVLIAPRPRRAPASPSSRNLLSDLLHISSRPDSRFGPCPRPDSAPRCALGRARVPQGPSLGTCRRAKMRPCSCQGAPGCALGHAKVRQGATRLAPGRANVRH